MTRVTRATAAKLSENTKENLENVELIEEVPRTPRKRGLKASSKIDCSPPKNRKEAAEPDSPGISNKFRTSLNILDENQSPRTYSKYSNARRALTSNEAYNLPGREKEVEKLKSFIDEALEHQKSCSLYISGQPGTGKTASLMKIMNTKEYQKKIEMAYVNCTSISSVGSIYKRIVSALDLKCRGTTEKECCQAIEDYLETDHKMLMIVLDEVDQLASKTQKVLYKIFEWPSWSDSRLILVGIANALDLTDRLLTRLNTRCELKPFLMHFEPYSKAQIIEIFKSRLEEAQVLDLFPPTTLQLLAAKVAAVSGDIRRALDIGRRVVAMAQHGNFTPKQLQSEALKTVGDEGKTVENPVQVREVLSVLSDVYGNAQKKEEEADSIPLQQKILICALLLIMKHDKNKVVTMARLHEVYRKVCGKRNLGAVDQAEFGNLCDMVEVQGVIRVQKKKEMRMSRVLLQWDEDEVQAALKDRNLIAAILADQSCLSR